MVRGNGKKFRLALIERLKFFVGKREIFEQFFDFFLRLDFIAHAPYEENARKCDEKCDGELGDKICHGRRDDNFNHERHNNKSCKQFRRNEFQIPEVIFNDEKSYDEKREDNDTRTDPEKLKHAGVRQKKICHKGKCNCRKGAQKYIAKLNFKNSRAFFTEVIFPIL